MATTGRCGGIPSGRPVRSGLRRIVRTSIRNPMNPRSTSQPKEYHSRRSQPAVIVLSGWIAARVMPATVLPIASRRQG